MNLRRGLARPADIYTAIRNGVRAAGMNLWVLMFAILIASVGLNMNSTAVIIGAMLISPLMGPIVGVGYGVGMRNTALLMLALRNLAVFTVISLGTSTLYFAVSPLSIAGSELLTRTSPTLWDVLIAFFGGAAGIVALTRRHGSTVVPGVANRHRDPPLDAYDVQRPARGRAHDHVAVRLPGLEAQFPAVGPVAISSPEATGPAWIRARWQRLPVAEQRRLQRWLAVRLEGRAVELVMPWVQPLW